MPVALTSMPITCARGDGYFKVRAPVLPFFAILTTAGSSSEVTVASVVSDPGAGRKFAMVDNKLSPAAIALDPKLMVGLPPHVTAATGTDALTDAIESHLSIGQHDLPFGGVGASGMGHYHGYEGFLTFSKLRPVFRQARFSSIQAALQPPYGKRAKLALDWMFRLRG